MSPEAGRTRFSGVASTHTKLHVKSEGEMGWTKSRGANPAVHGRQIWDSKTLKAPGGHRGFEIVDTSRPLAPGILCDDKIHVFSLYKLSPLNFFAISLTDSSHGFD